MRYEFVMGSEIKTIQAQKLRVLDSSVYDLSQTVSTSLIHSFHKKNPNIYVIAMDLLTKQPVGYISCIPLQRKTLKQVFSRNFHESDLNIETIVIPEKTRSFDLFFSSIVVDPKAKDKQFIALGMIKKYLNYIEKLMFSGNFPNEAAAHATSFEGARFCEKMGMVKTSSDFYGGIIYHSDNISRSFFYKNMNSAKRDLLRNMIIEKLTKAKLNEAS